MSRSKNQARKGAQERKHRELPVAETNQEYARVTAMLGNGRVRAKLFDGEERLCRIRGSMRRREWVHVGDTVLVAFREELADDTADIVFKYQPEEVQALVRLGEPVHIAVDEDEEGMDDVVAFAEEDACAVDDI
jgi:translation initiation factor 1A